jgi:hypothetical protein
MSKIAASIPSISGAARDHHVLAPEADRLVG